MGLLRRIESRIEKVFEGGIGRTFRSHVQPVEIARKLRKEMDDHRTISISQVYVPNIYTVFLAEQDRDQFSIYEASLRTELAAYLSEHARREAYTLPGRIRVIIQTAPELELGTFGIGVAVEEEPLYAAPPPAMAGGVPVDLPPGVELPPEFAEPVAVPPGADPFDLDAASQPGSFFDEVEAEVEPLAQPATETAGDEVEPEAPEEDLDRGEALPIAAAAGGVAPAVAAVVAAEPAAPSRPVAAVAEAPPTTVLRAETWELVWPGGRHPLTQAVTVVGRSHGCDVMIEDGNISRRHAELVRTATGFEVRDLGSTNGTVVNGRRVRQGAVGAGDTILFGTTVVSLERSGPS